MPLRPDLVPPANDKVATFLGLSGPKPATWIWHPPVGSMSVVEYSIPGVDGADQAKVVVIPARGSMEANIARWKGQFRDAAGNVGAVDPKLEKFEVADMPVTIVEIAGEYRGMGAANYAPDQLFLTAVLEPEGNADQIFVRFVGPRTTVEANREAFMTMIKGLKRVEPQK